MPRKKYFQKSLHRSLNKVLFLKNSFPSKDKVAFSVSSYTVSLAINTRYSYLLFKLKFLLWTISPVVFVFFTKSKLLSPENTIAWNDLAQGLVAGLKVTTLLNHSQKIKKKRHLTGIELFWKEWSHTQRLTEGVKTSLLKTTLKAIGYLCYVYLLTKGMKKKQCSDVSKQIVTVWDKVSSDSTLLELAGWMELKELRQNWKLYSVAQKTMSSKVTRKLHDKQAGNEFEWDTSLNRSMKNQHYGHLKLI